MSAYGIIADIIRPLIGVGLTGGCRPLADIHVILFLAILPDGKAAFRLGFGAISGWNRITDTRIFSRQRDRVYK